MTRLAAVQAASNALNELRLDQSEPIDPFEAIEASGLELRFRPLKDLLGAVLPGNPGGVLINSDRPATLQRYTAAHELGHWYMDQDVLSVDNEDAVLGQHRSGSRELNAQVFAAHFLMPLELLYPTARRYGITSRSRVEPEQAYQAARDMHVSYEAAVRQLTNTKHIAAENSAALLKARPVAIKRKLADGLELPNARGEVWILDHPHDRAEINAFVGDAIVLRLTERPSTGYRWCAEETHATIHPFRPAPRPFREGTAFTETDSAPSGEVIAFPSTNASSEVATLLLDHVVGESYHAETSLIGGAVTRVVAYSAEAPGEDSIRLTQIRPGRPDIPVDRLDVTAFVRGTPEVEFRQRLLAAFMRDEQDGVGWGQ